MSEKINSVYVAKEVMGLYFVFNPNDRIVAHCGPGKAGEEDAELLTTALNWYTEKRLRDARKKPKSELTAAERRRMKGSQQ